MSYSEISICNLALGMIGEDSIRSFDEKNKRARLCKNLYDFARDEVLVKVPWTFASCYKKLQKLDISSSEIPEGMAAFQLPNDCLKPLDIAPYGTRQKWHQYGTKVFTSQDPTWLHYTKKVTATGEFYLPFISVLVPKLALLLAPPITKNVKITSEMRNAYMLAEQENFPTDANIGSNLKNADDEAMLDTFVSPSGTIKIVSSRWLSTD